jgi:hypothetical protein
MLGFASLTVPSIFAQNPPSSDLPPVIENLGLDDPPDLPTQSNLQDSKAPAQPLRSSPERTPSRTGSVLDSLDNLPPVGASESRQAGSNATVSGEPLKQGPGPQPDAIAPSRVVRFGDVKSESSVQNQFKDRRSTDPNSKPGSSANAPRFRPDEPPASRPKTLMDRLMPWRKPAASNEPPLIRDKADATNDDELIDRPESGSSGKPGNRAEMADRVDSEIQKRVDRVARQEVGSRTNELNVEVVNREVYIRARPMWFWQRRQISEELQKLPGVDSKRLHITVY